MCYFGITFEINTFQVFVRMVFLVCYNELPLGNLTCCFCCRCCNLSEVPEEVIRKCWRSVCVIDEFIETGTKLVIVLLQGEGDTASRDGAMSLTRVADRLDVGFAYHVLSASRYRMFINANACEVDFVGLRYGCLSSLKLGASVNIFQPLILDWGRATIHVMIRHCTVMLGGRSGCETKFHNSSASPLPLVLQCHYSLTANSSLVADSSATDICMSGTVRSRFPGLTGLQERLAIAGDYH